MKERRVPREQLAFGQRGQGEMFVPESVLDKLWSSQVVGFLESRRIWKNRPSGLAVGFTSEERGFFEKFIFNPSNWQAQEEENARKYAACLIVTSPSLIPDLSFLLNGFPLKEKAPFYVFERYDGFSFGKGEKEKRITLLRSLGLVEGVVLRSKVPGFLVWEARVKKERVARPVDLLNKEKHPRSYSYARELWGDMSKEYSKYGFKVVSGADSEILQVLRTSKNPPDDLNKLRLGWGVEIRNPSCGCHFRVSLDGVFETVYSCGDETCHLG